MEEVLEENRVLREKVEQVQQINAALVSRNFVPGLLIPPDGPQDVSFRGPPRRNSHLSSRESRVRKQVRFEDEDVSEEASFLRTVRNRVLAETEMERLQCLILDMQKVSNGLVETVLDKTTALKHQTVTNRLLGQRVTELEAQITALQMSGFWSVPDRPPQATDSTARQDLERLTLRGVPSHDFPCATEGEEEGLLVELEEDGEVGEPGCGTGSCADSSDGLLGVTPFLDPSIFFSGDGKCPIGSSEGDYDGECTRLIGPAGRSDGECERGVGECTRLISSAIDSMTDSDGEEDVDLIPKRERERDK